MSGRVKQTSWASRRSASTVSVEEGNGGLLPRHLIFADPERSGVRISPDGTRIAFRAPVDGILNLRIAPIERIGEAHPVTAVTDRNLGPSIIWMRDNRHVVFFREAGGDENWRAQEGNLSFDTDVNQALIWWKIPSNAAAPAPWFYASRSLTSHCGCSRWAVFPAMPRVRPFPLPFRF